MGAASSMLRVCQEATELHEVRIEWQEEIRIRLARQPERLHRLVTCAINALPDPIRDDLGAKPIEMAATSWARPSVP